MLLVDVILITAALKTALARFTKAAFQDMNANGDTAPKVAVYEA
jgi:hypothetical protein